MGSAGLEFDANDSPEKARLNQKTTFVGTGAQISGLSTTYPGQFAFCTSTGSGYTADVLYVRNAANSAWVSQVLTDTISETTETTTTPITDDTNHDAVAGTRYYQFITLPTTDPLYIITNISWKNGTNQAGTIISGVDLIDADPPTVASTPLLALGLEVTQSGADQNQSCGYVSSNMIRGGSVIGVWVACSSASADLRKVTGTSQNQRKAVAAYTSSPSASDSTAWTATTDKYNITCTYRSYY